MSVLLRLRPAWVAILMLLGCAKGEALDLPLLDASVDTSVADATITDAATDAVAGDAALDASFVFDGAVPENAAVLFAEINRGGATRLITADVPNLMTFTNNAASMVIPAGYTLYGTTLANYGGDLSDPYVGPMTVDDLGALANQWDAVIFRASSEPVATVYRAVSSMPKVYPLGTFPSLGDVNDTIDGINLPAGVSFVGFDDLGLTGIERGPYVGPLNVGALPYRDMWSSFIVRASTASDPEVGDVRLFKNGTYGGEMLVLTQGAYPDLDVFPGVGDFNNTISSVRGRNGLAIFAFQYRDYGGNVFTPLVGDSTQVPQNDDWDSVVIQPVSAPTLTVYFDAGFTTPGIYPIVNVSNLQGRSNAIDGVAVPAGYVVHAFSHTGYGGMTGPTWRHTEGMSATVVNDWDSFIVRRVTDPVVTLYFTTGMGTPREYPLGAYMDLESVNDQIRGANVPCGVRIQAWQNENRGGSTYEVVGPTNIASVPGEATWSSMEITQTTCP